MEHGAPRPKKRRSLFELETEAVTNKTHIFPQQSRQVLYSTEYIQKVTTEIEEWKLRVLEALKGKKSAKKVAFEFKNKVFDESCLTKEQLDFLSFDTYCEVVKDFCDRLVILGRKMNKDQENREFKTRYLDTQKKIEELFLSKG